MKVNTKSKKVNKAWLNDHVNDPYVKQAQREGYRARAAYKLKEIDEALGLIKPGQVVVDLGAVPGAWSQYLRRKFAPRAAGVGGAAVGELDGTIIALDMLPFEPIEGVQFIQGDIREDEVMAALEAALGGPGGGRGGVGHGAQSVGHRQRRCRPHGPSGGVGDRFFARHLTPQGALVAKMFHGSGYSQLVEVFKKTFRVVKPIKPKASRDRSSETFIVGIGLKNPAR